MPELDLALQIEATERGKAVPRMGRRHVAVHPDARILTIIALAGEDTDAHIMLFGPPGDNPDIAFVPDPRHRDDLFAMYRGLKDRLEAYYASCRAASTYPQLWVSSSAGARHLDALADRLRNARADADVRRLGDLLTYPAVRYHVAGQQSLCPATAVLSHHYATGQQPSEDEHLGALMSWVDPQPGVGIYEAVETAQLVPMAVHTDPTFDAATLVPLMERYNRERKRRARPPVLAGLAHEIRDALWLVAQAIYHATGRAVDVLQRSGLPPLPALPDLEEAEAEAFESFMRSRDDGYHIPNRDSYKRAVFLLEGREVAIENYEAAAVLGDPVHRLRARLEGRVLHGAVRGVRKVRLAPRKFEHRIAVETCQGALRVRRGDELYWAADTRLRLVVRHVRRHRNVTTVDLATLSGVRAAGVPVVGAAVDLVSSVPNWDRLWRRRGQLQGRLDTMPWTHQATSPSPATTALAATKAAPTVDPLTALEALR